MSFLQRFAKSKKTTRRLQTIWPGAFSWHSPPLFRRQGLGHYKVPAAKRQLSPRVLTFSQDSGSVISVWLVFGGSRLLILGWPCHGRKIMAIRTSGIPAQDSRKHLKLELKYFDPSPCEWNPILAGPFSGTQLLRDWRVVWLTDTYCLKQMPTFIRQWCSHSRNLFGIYTWTFPNPDRLNGHPKSRAKSRSGGCRTVAPPSPPTRGQRLERSPHRLSFSRFSRFWE